jgi:hypothetical protein
MQAKYGITVSNIPWEKYEEPSWGGIKRLNENAIALTDERREVQYGYICSAPQKDPRIEAFCNDVIEARQQYSDLGVEFDSLDEAIDYLQTMEMNCEMELGYPPVPKEDAVCSAEITVKRDGKADGPAWQEEGNAEVAKQTARYFELSPKEFSIFDFWESRGRP